MNPSVHTALANSPLPVAQFRRFLAIFHVVFLGGILFSLVVRWNRPGFAWAPAEAPLLLLAAAQIGLYVWFFVLLKKPASAITWWLGYFSLSLAIWLVEWHLEPALRWTVFAYLGQMFGVLRPAISVPFCLAVFATYFGLRNGWQALNVYQLTAGGSLVVSVTALGLFLHRLTITSSERAKLIADLEAAQQELERARERDLELAALRERERLARELHDSLGHGLVTLTVQLEAVQKLLATDPAKATAMLEQMQALTRDSMAELRRALAGLRSAALGDRPLGVALEELCEQHRQAGLAVQCAVIQTATDLPPIVADTLWRAAQEALTNVRKHARAQSASLKLHVAAEQATLTVADDGEGFVPENLDRPNHYGLRGLRERAEGLGGTLTVEANQPGTRLKLRVPVVQR